MYYALVNQVDGKLISAGTEIAEPQEGQILLFISGELPNLEKYEWHPGSMAFIEKNKSRFITKYAFLERFEDSELVGIYTLSKSDINVEVWLDKFKMVLEVNLDEPELQEKLPLFELAGILQPGRAAEILA